MNRLTKLATALSLSCTVVLVASCDRSAPTDLDPESDLSSSLVAQVAPPGFTAFPYAPDFVVTGSEGGFQFAEHYFPSNGDGSFGFKSNIPGLGNVEGLDVADMDGDGDNDILICDGTSAEVYLYTNDGSGTFSTSVVATGITPFACTYLRIADFDEDGNKDFVLGEVGGTNGMFVYLQASPGVFVRVLPGLDLASWSNSSWGVAVGDVDGDRHQDVLVLGFVGIGAGQVRFYKGDGTGAMAASTLLFNIGTDFGVQRATGLSLFDLEGDGDLDIVAGGGISSGAGGGGTHYVYANDGAGNFTPPSGFAFDLDVQTGIDAFDFDADGDHDLVLATWAGLRSLVYVENLGGTLAAPVIVGTLAYDGIGIGAPAFVGVTKLEVDIDIKPGSDPNTINPKGKGVVPVAVLGNAEFDVAEIDRTTLAFGPDGAAPAHQAGGHLENVNGDAYMDLVSHYRQQATGIAFGDMEACVTGQTLGGTVFEGCDAVRVLNK